MNMVIVGGRNCGKELALERMVELAHSLGKNILIVSKDYPKINRIDLGYGSNN